MFKEKGKKAEGAALLARVLADLLYSTIKGERVIKIIKTLL